MNTEVVSLDPAHPEAARIARAADVLRRGGLVAFPTETVYGLAANALDESAVARIFAAKGRPATNPLIVHIVAAEQASNLVRDWPEAAEKLARCFWPGPLTLVCFKSAVLPDVVTAGGPTVALRVPAHPVAHALLHAAGLPVAAPSANRSTQLSPTRAEHVFGDLAGRVEMILDAGPTPGGIESTVLDVTTRPPRLLRPGLVTPAQIEAVIGPILRGGDTTPRTSETLRSPGLLKRHYAPRAALECVAGDARLRVEALARAGQRIGWITFAERMGVPAEVRTVVMPDEAAAYAARLYDVLHSLDEAGVEHIIAELPPDTEEWLAVRDRLRRAITD